MAKQEPKNYAARYEEPQEIMVAGEVFLYPEAEYKKLDPEVESRVKAIVVDIRVRQRNALSDMIATGHQLMEAKLHLGHGNFEEWAQDEFGLSRGSLVELRQVAERFGDKSSIIEHLNPTTARLLAPRTVSDDVVQAVVDLSVEWGRPLLVREVKEVRRLVEAKTAALSLPSDSAMGAESEEDNGLDASYYAVVLEDVVWLRLRQAMRQRNLDRNVTADDLDKFAVAVAAGLSEGTVVGWEEPAIEVLPPELTFEKWLEEMPSSDDVADIASFLRVALAKLWVVRQHEGLEVPAINVLPHLQHLIEEIDKRVS